MVTRKQKPPYVPDIRLNKKFYVFPIDYITVAHEKKILKHMKGGDKN